MHNSAYHIFFGVLAYIAIVCDAGAQQNSDVLVKKVAVITELGRGIMAELRILDVSDQDTHFGYTDDKGIAHPNQICDKKNRLLAKPSISAYRVLGRPPYCDSEVTIRMHLPRVAVALTESADRALSDGNYGVATMLYSEAAVRLAESDPKTSEKIELKAYEAAIRKLGLESNAINYDPHQEKYVLSRSGVNALIAFQRSNNLRVTGSLDSSTTRVMSGQPIFPHIKAAYGDLSRRK